MPTTRTGATSPEGVICDAFFTEVSDMVINLYERWMEEKEYENINDYALPLANAVKKHNITNLKMNKRPFGCTFTIAAKTYQIYCSQSSGCGWKRVS